MIGTPIRAIPEDPQPGDFVLSVITGRVGFWVRIAQAIIGDTTKYNHAALVVDTDGTTVEAMPGGARYSKLEQLVDRDVYYHRAYYLTEYQRDWIAKAAHERVGTPYSFVMYLALGMSYFGKIWPRLKRYLGRDDRLICSQLIEASFRAGGVTMFTDNRLKGDVPPGDLFWFALTKDLEKP